MGTLIVIPMRGGNELTKLCIESIKKFVKTPHQVVVIDNANTFRMRDIPVIKGDNWGFAKSVNVAAKWDGNLDLLIMNNDVEATCDFLAPMKKLAGYNIGVVGSMLLYPDGKIQHIGSSYNNGNPNHPHKGEFLRDCPDAFLQRAVEGVTFACALITRECWDDLDGLDEKNYPFGYEDIDFCKRAWEQGWEVFYCPEARLIHKEHVTQRKFLKDIRPKSDESLRNLRRRWG